jgi:hypothetical protein
MVGFSEALAQASACRREATVSDLRRVRRRRQRAVAPEYPSSFLLSSEARLRYIGRRHFHFAETVGETEVPEQTLEPMPQKIPQNNCRESTFKIFSPNQAIAGYQ